MTTPKAWMQRETKQLVHEFRSKAYRRLNTVLLVCSLFIFAYIQVGESRVSIEAAKSVPMAWKYLTLLVMFATIWVVHWRIWRRTFDLSLRRLERGWVIWLAIVVFGFAVVSADKPTLFYIGTLAWVAFLWISDWYYTRKHERLEHAKHVA